jgi:hypothetical protein
MFNQLINQNNMILSLLNTVINKITTNGEFTTDSTLERQWTNKP